MAVVVEGSGTQTATIGTEHTLDTVTVAGVFVLMVDCSNMVAGDILELRVKKPILAAGAAVIEYFAVFYGGQPTENEIKTSVPVVQDSVAAGLVFTLKQTFGTGRAFPWKVNAIG